MWDDDLDYLDGNDLNDIIVMKDENGVNVTFEFLDVIEYEGNEYVVLVPVNDDGIPTVVILQVDENTDDIENYIAVKDEETLQKVFEIFKARFKDVFDFIDPDE